MRAWPMTKNFRLFSSVLYFFAALSSSAVAAVDITVVRELKFPIGIHLKPPLRTPQIPAVLSY